jgi:hypothetical protein
VDRLADTIRGELGRFGGDSNLVALVERWPAAVGATIARNAWPARIGRDGTLHVNAADAIWAFELTQRAGEIASRLEIATVRFTPGPVARPVEEREDPAAAVVAPSADEVQAATEAAAAIDDENLREAIKKAMSLSLARSASDRPV